MIAVEVASAKTQTSKSADVYPHSTGYPAVPSQFVVGTIRSTCDVYSIEQHVVYVMLPLAVV